MKRGGLVSEWIELFEKDDFEEYISHEYPLKNRKQKMELLDKVFRYETILEEDKTEVDFLTIYDSWEAVLAQSYKKDLLDIAKRIDVKVDRSYTRERLATLIAAKVKKQPQLLDTLLNSEEKELLAYIRKMAAEKDSIVFDEKFPFSLDAVKSLMRLGLVDILCEADMDTFYLTFFVIEE